MGQHFLNSGKYIALFLDALEGIPGERILEIGPGRGALTKRLVDAGYRVFAVEKDRAMGPGLSGITEELLTGDALFIPDNLDAFLRERGITRIIGNLPFYSATPILIRYLKYLHVLKGMVFSFQKEVGDRITAQPGRRPYAALTVIVRTYSVPERIGIIPPGAFSPPPEVETLVVRFLPVSCPDLSFNSFCDFVFGCFQHPRKTLANNLRRMGMDEDPGTGSKRPGELSPGEFVDLFKKLEAA